LLCFLVGQMMHPFINIIEQLGQMAERLWRQLQALLSPLIRR
jgi:hypothetical protein